MSRDHSEAETIHGFDWHDYLYMMLMMYIVGMGFLIFIGVLVN